MKTTTRWIVSAVLLGAAITGAPAQIVGSPLRSHMIQDIRGSEAKSLDEFAGRLVLLELFAYW